MYVCLYKHLSFSVYVCLAICLTVSLSLQGSLTGRASGAPPGVALEGCVPADKVLDDRRGVVGVEGGGALERLHTGQQADAGGFPTSG